ncbi:far upstream element-binding protein 1-like isoform X1 [Tachypleus tridentatus]|uniref:far upstream element-binding protein 1-like isoform X1 n=1 Tax=Tachypleus tridentatus TaxID=6853 RepID=UPI003FD42ACB
MTDFKVGSQSTGSFESTGSSAFADALQRARQIAAKFTPSGGDNNSAATGTKRPLENSMDPVTDGAPDPKKPAAVNDPFGAQLAAMKQQISNTASDSTKIMNEEYRVPDRLVGLIIGRGGEQIMRLQAESGCKIQLSSESEGKLERTCVLTGTKQAVEKVKEMLDQILKRVDIQGQPEEGQIVVDMMIPGNKVGLVIGKGGETIRQLQEQTGAKMIMIQDGPQQTIHDKPLRITGLPSQCEFAKQQVMQLIAGKDQDVNVARNGDYQYGSGAQEQVMVPKQAVGVVIGKSGETIKRIQQDSGGAKIQFHLAKEDTPGEKLCMVTGTPEQVQKAVEIIHELIHSVMVRDQQFMGRGRGRGRGFDGPGGGPRFGPPGGPGMGRGRPDGDFQEVQYTVPANKCGLVIGKGGETIRNISQQSGAHVELSRAPQPNLHEKVFIIRGAAPQIEQAQHLINEKIDMRPSPGQNGPPPYPSSQYPQPYQQNQQTSQPYAPQGWGNSYPQWQTQSNDPNKDANAAAWAAYYAQYYNQQAQHQTQQPTQAQQSNQQGSQPHQTTHSMTSASGQADYSAAWIEYYRLLGMHREADMIEQQTRGNQQVIQQYGQETTEQYGQQPQPTAATHQGQGQVPATQASQNHPTGVATPSTEQQWQYSQQTPYTQQPNQYQGYGYSQQ